MEDRASSTMTCRWGYIWINQMITVDVDASVLTDEVIIDMQMGIHLD